MKRGVVVSTELCPDMVPLYGQLLDSYKDRPELCPTIYVVDEIMKGISYLKNADVLLLKQGSRLERAMKSDNYPYSLKLCSFGNSAETIYSVALHVCSLLQIQCPLILPSKSLSGVRGEAYQNSRNLTKLILLRSGMGLQETIEVLLHELRHAWQHEKHQNRFFDNYKFLSSGIDLKTYCMQPAEIDAEAFSFRVMQMYGCTATAVII